MRRPTDCTLRRRRARHRRDRDAQLLLLNNRPERSRPGSSFQLAPVEPDVRSPATLAMEPFRAPLHALAPRRSAVASLYRSGLRARRRGRSLIIAHDETFRTAFGTRGAFRGNG
jgi:hypothetical protein